MKKNNINKMQQKSIIIMQDISNIGSQGQAFTSGLGLDAMSLAWPTVVQLVVSFNSGLQWGG